MPQTDFDRSLPRILVYEGGRVDNPKDPGGRTNKGITQATFNAYRRKHGAPIVDVYGISDTDVADIYKTEFWDVIQGDKLPSGLNFEVFDGGVNSGNGRSVMWLQSALGLHYAGQIDGQIGDKTIQAIEDFGDVDALIEAYCSRRLGTLKRLKTWGEFGKGWAARVANGQKTAIAWHDASVPYPVDVTSLGGHMKAVVNDNTMSQPPVQQLTTHLATAGGSVATAAASAGQQITPLVDTFAWVKYIAAGLTLAAVGAGIIVKISTDANEAAVKSTATASVDPDADADLPIVATTEAAA